MKKLNKVLTIVAATVISTSAFAAQQGQLVHGDKNITSTGKFDVTLGVKNAIQINDLQDLNLGDFENGNAVGNIGTASQDFCVFTNASSFSLNVAGGANGFVMSEETDSSLQIDYAVDIATKDVNGNSTAFQSVAHNQTLTGITETRNRVNCNVVNGSNPAARLNNMVIQVSVTEAEMLDAVPGSYKDTITLIASPE